MNAVWDLATHDIAIFNHLLKETPEWVSAVGARVLGNCRVDVGFICLGYAKGVVGHIHVSWADPNKCREVVVVCSDRRLVFNDLNGVEPVRIYEKGVSAVGDEPENFGEYQLKIREGAIISPAVEPSEPLKNQCRHFIECVHTGERPQTDVEDGVSVLATLEAIERSIQLQGTTIKVERHECYASAAWPTNIPLLDLHAQYHSIKREVDEAMTRVIEKSDFILGSELELFESEFATFCGAKCCVGVDSGLSALELVLRAWGIGARG